MTDKEKLNSIYELVKNDSSELSSGIKDILMIGRSKTLKTFQKPTIPEIQAYCDERGNGIDSESFWNHYESKGWVIGKSPMKSWQSAIITWEKKKKEDSKNKYKTNGNSKRINQDQRDELLTMMNDKTQKMFGNKGD